MQEILPCTHSYLHILNQSNLLPANEVDCIPVQRGLGPGPLTATREKGKSNRSTNNFIPPKFVTMTTLLVDHTAKSYDNLLKSIKIFI